MSLYGVVNSHIPCNCYPTHLEIFTLCKCLLSINAYSLEKFTLWKCLLSRNVYSLEMFILWKCLLSVNAYSLEMFTLWKCLLWKYLRGHVLSIIAA